MSLPLLGSGSGAGAIGSNPTPGSNAAAFLARTSGLDTTHQNAYINLINGLDTDSLFTKIDMLHIYATQDSTTALLNLISTSFNGTANGSPTFTADRGFTGVESSTTVYIDTNHNMSTGVYLQNSAHLSAWVVTNAQGTACLGWANFVTGNNSYVFPRDGSNTAHIRINSNASAANVASTDSRGHWLNNRSGSAAVQLYKDGSSVLTDTTASIGLSTTNMYSLGWSSVGGNPTGYGQQMAMASIGGSLNSTEAGNFYSRLRTFMTAVGVP